MGNSLDLRARDDYFVKKTCVVSNRPNAVTGLADWSDAKRDLIKE